MMRLLFLLAALLSLASVVVDARYFEVYRIRPFFETSDDVAYIPQRRLRQVVDYQPLPCRWKLCASYY